MLRSDLQHVLDARLLGFSWSFNTLSWYCSLRFSWNFQHALGATLLTSSWNCQRSLDASLLCYAFSLGTSSRLLMLGAQLPHVLNATRSILFHWTSWAFSWNTPALPSFGFGKKIRRFYYFNLMIDPCLKDLQLRLQKRATRSWIITSTLYIST